MPRNAGRRCRSHLETLVLHKGEGRLTLKVLAASTAALVLGTSSVYALYIPPRPVYTPPPVRYTPPPVRYTPPVRYNNPVRTRTPTGHNTVHATRPQTQGSHTASNGNHPDRSRHHGGTAGPVHVATGHPVTIGGTHYRYAPPHAFHNHGHAPINTANYSWLPPHIHHNPRHVAHFGAGHNFHNFIWAKNHHRWHRWYYAWWTDGVVGYYYYDTPADDASDDDMVADLTDTDLPSCDVYSDMCSEGGKLIGDNSPDVDVVASAK
jgi:hypothetical protein